MAQMKRYKILTLLLLLAFTATVCLANDGTVRNANNATIGKAPGVKREWAAAFFFFNFFQ